EGFVTLDPEWRFTYVNRRAEQMLGRSRQELLGRKGLDVFPQGIGSRIHQELDRARQQQSLIEFESLTTPGNRWFEVRAYPAEEGGLTIYFRDVTRKKRAQESITLQARMLDAVGQAVIAVANDGTVFYWNKAAERLLGWTADQVIGRAAIAVMHPEHQAGGVAEALKRLKNAETWAGEVTLRRRDGSRFPAHVSDSPIHDEHDAVIGMVRVATDASARHADEEAQRLLAKAGSALAATLDYQHTLAALVQFAVPELADCCIVDVAESEGTGRRVEIAWSSNVNQAPPRFSTQAGKGSATAAKLLKKGESTLISRVTDETLNELARNTPELRRLRNANVRSVIVAPLNIGARELGTFSLISTTRNYNRHDLALVTELARRAAFAIDNAMLYETASMANQAKSDFLAVMSHELRTPLTTVMGYTDLLLAGVPNPLTSHSQVYVERIRSAAWHLLGLIEQILIYARLEVGREQVHVEKAPVARILREAAELIEPVALEKGLAFGLTEPPHEATIETDVTKLRQILLNLLSNAVKFTFEGEIHLEARMTPTSVLFLVRDTGVGISPEHQERVFEPFWQVDQSATRKEGGTGIGLSVSRKLAGLLGGEIRVQSTPESGTVFTVELPLAALTQRG
ncbi:MAG TPA: PAS domain S-box protein, partial [Longimicrobiales bacterium]